jgi:hypothetical protein
MDMTEYRYFLAIEDIRLIAAQCEIRLEVVVRQRTVNVLQIVQKEELSAIGALRCQLPAPVKKSIV